MNCLPRVFSLLLLTLLAVYTDPVGAQVPSPSPTPTVQQPTEPRSPMPDSLLSMVDLIMAISIKRTNFLILNWHRFGRGRFYKRSLWGQNSRIFLAELHSALVNVWLSAGGLVFFDRNQEL